MSTTDTILKQLDTLIKKEIQDNKLLFCKTDDNPNSSNSITYQSIRLSLNNVMNLVNDLANLIQNDDSVLISVKHQKLLQMCFQLITTLGISQCLLPGLGIRASKRCDSALLITQWTDEQKYDLLCECTDFFTRIYRVSVLKKNIITYHLSDYLASLVQLSYAPLKKPGTYNNFIMTAALFERLNVEREKYIQIYNNLVNTCFQPFIIRDLLILNSVKNPPPPKFVKRILARELSSRLLAEEGLLSLIRCFTDSYDNDPSLNWKKNATLCKIISGEHGNVNETDYLCNICSQLQQIFLLSNTNYLSAAVASLSTLNEQFKNNTHVKSLVTEIFHAFNYNNLLSKCSLPGTVILSPQEVQQKVLILHAYIYTTSLNNCSAEILSLNVYVLFMLGVKCTKNKEMSMKLLEITLKCCEDLTKKDVTFMMNSIFVIERYPLGNNETLCLNVEEYDAGMAIKCIKPTGDVTTNSDDILYLIKLLKASTSKYFVKTVFEEALQLLILLNDKRQCCTYVNNNIFNHIYESYVCLLQLLTEMSTLPKITESLKTNPSVIANFVEHILNNHKNPDDECVTIALVLLNAVVSNNNGQHFVSVFSKTVPIIKSIAKNERNLNHILCKEILSVIETGKPHNSETAYSKALIDITDRLLPVRAHGIVSLTKLIEQKDPESISKKYYIFCLLQEQLQSDESYIYLATINGIAALGSHCTEDVLHVLCKEYLEISFKNDEVQNKNKENEMSENRMKVGDVIVKIIKNLGEMAIVHKSLLLNTILCVCRDEDPLIRASALSNLAEIARVLHYKVGTIIYEILHCVWATVETDKAVECRRAGVMVISNLLKGLGKETLVQLKDNLLPIYRALKKLYADSNEDAVVRLHAQIGLEQLNDIVNEFLFPNIDLSRQIIVLDKHESNIK